MTKVKLEAVQRELDIRRNMLASGQLDLPPIANVMICAANGEVDALLTEIRQLRLEIASILNDAGCPLGMGPGVMGPGVLPPWTYRRLDDLLNGKSATETVAKTAENSPKCVGCGKPVPDYVLQATQPRPTGFICAACAP